MAYAIEVYDSKLNRWSTWTAKSVRPETRKEAMQEASNALDMYDAVRVYRDDCGLFEK